MSRYEDQISPELVHFFISEIRESQSSLEPSCTMTVGFKRIARAALKMYFVWLVETVREIQSSLNLPSEFDFVAMRKARNILVHTPEDWGNNDVVVEIENYVSDLERLVIIPNR